jgi:DNA-directed RNA polymerase specialized sigma24 family protein
MNLSDANLQLQVQTWVLETCRMVASRFRASYQEIYPGVVSDVCYRLLQAEIHTSVEGFVRTSAKYFARRACLKKRNPRECVIDDFDFDSYLREDWKRLDPSRQAEEQELLARVERAKSNLPSLDRAAVETWQGARCRDRAVQRLAAEWGKKRQDVDRSIHRSLEQIRRELTEREE